MANTALSERQELKVNSEREMQVYKRDDMIQKGRHALSVQEQRCVLYAISKIKPTDSVFQQYTFELSDFYNLCGLKKSSYSKLKDILLGLKQNSWWVEDPTAPGKEVTISWFNKVKTDKTSGTVTVRFDDDMMPFLLALSGKETYYTHYNIKYILPMRSQYSIRLYELLKSYQKNNYSWFFDIDKLKKLLYCENYTRYPDFRRNVLEPAEKEINKYTDINISWEEVKEGRKVVRIIFHMIGKKKGDLFDTELAIKEELDGQINFFDILNKENVKKTGIFFRENSDCENSAKE